MKTKYYIGYNNLKYKTEIYNQQEDFKRLLKEKEHFHDWEISDFHLYSSDCIEIILKFDNEYYMFKFNGVVWKYQFLLTIGNHYVSELNITIDDFITMNIDGAGITITAKDLFITTSEQIDSFPDGIEPEIMQ